MAFDNHHTVATRRAVLPPSQPPVRSSWAFVKGMALGVVIAAVSAAFVFPAIFAAPNVVPPPQRSTPSREAAATPSPPAPAAVERGAAKPNEQAAPPVSAAAGDAAKADPLPCDQQAWPNIDRKCLKDGSGGPVASPPVRDVTPRRDAPASPPATANITPPADAKPTAPPGSFAGAPQDAKPQVQDTRPSRSERRSARREDTRRGDTRREEARAEDAQRETAKSEEVWPEETRPARSERRSARREHARRPSPDDRQGEEIIIERAPRERGIFGLFSGDGPATRYYRGRPEWDW